MTGPKVVGSIPPDAPTAAPEPPKKQSGDRGSKVLPTDRVGYTKQYELLRGYAAMAAQGKSVISNAEVAELVKIHPNTAILAHPFFLDVGFLRKDGTGYAVAPEVLAYVKAISWNAETAPHKLAPLLRKTWFADALVPTLLMQKPLQERTAIEMLASVSGAGPKYEGLLKTILAYLVTTGIMRKEGDTYYAGPALEDGAMRGATAQPEVPPSRVESEEPPRYNAARGSSLTTGFAAAPEGVLRFNVDVSVDMKEFATWKPERISAFWAGIAQVLAAKAGVEQAVKG